jgi:hypothetical protein
VGKCGIYPLFLNSPFLLFSKICTIFPTMLAALVAATLVHAVHHSVYFEDIHAFPKYAVHFLNALPIDNHTALSWLTSGHVRELDHFLDLTPPSTPPPLDNALLSPDDEVLPRLHPKTPPLTHAPGHSPHLAPAHALESRESLPLLHPPTTPRSAPVRRRLGRYGACIQELEAAGRSFRIVSLC